MSVVPYGYANDVESVFDLNEDTIYGVLPTPHPPTPHPLLMTQPLLTLPEGLPIGSSKVFVLKSENPAKTGRNQRYAVTVNVSIRISTPQVTVNAIKIGIGGIGYVWNGIPVPGNGFPGFEKNPTMCGGEFPLSQWTSSGATDAILTVTGETTVKAEKGIVMGIKYQNLDPADTTQILIDSLTYQFRQVG